ncbi:nestin [Cyprinodon tularosa]|uniref:nestin n=1 Tax=Cyprinodon tularosa TaxID=77115 RepID=UPI0018E264E8|nr:nestin [Cyprinodon tularosa]
MELHGVHKIFHANHFGEEKQQMLNLNRRLETYLSRVKLLEEENEMLANEINVLRHNNQGTLTRRKGLEEELRQARLEVDAAWRDRVLTEVEVQKLSEEIQALELQRQREAEAKMLAKTKMEQSRKEMEDEQRAQIWLREKVNQLEHEMRFLIQTHEEDVAHLEATMTQSRAKMIPNLIQRSKQTPDLLQVGHEFSQRATRAWQEAAEAYQSQLAQLEESLGQARSRLGQVCQEKRESQLKLQTLEKEIASAKDVRLHLEKAVAQRREEHCHQIQQLQEHLEELEVEKLEVSQQIDDLLQENQNLMRLKMSLGLEVATYRALLDGESRGREAALLNKPRNISIRDAVQIPQGVKRNYPTQLSPSFKTTYPSSVQGRTESAITATQNLSRRSAALREPPKITRKVEEAAAVTSAATESPYPKIVQNGAAEDFRPKEVHEKVTYAEPLSPPNEEETSEKMSEDEVKTDVEAAIESVVSHRAEFGLGREPNLVESAVNHQLSTPNPVLCSSRMAEPPCYFSDEAENDATLEVETEQENVQQQMAKPDASTKVDEVFKEVVQDETSDSETEAMLEATSESRPSSPESEREKQENYSIQDKDNRPDESMLNFDVGKEFNISKEETKGSEDEDKLYPDGEEMDTWDSVIERRVSEGKEDDNVRNEGNKDHAEPEEDISAKEPELENRNFNQLGNMASVLQQVDGDQEHVPPPDKEDEEDEEDSQNVSVSWKTERESDSYAQENTLADTRPLIRYKSDDTDANTQASHFDESESSDGEQEKKAGEAGTGTWGDGKPKTFGTMEDLCEEVEEETVDDDYNLGYTHVEERDVEQSETVCEDRELVNETENVAVVSGIEEHSEEETEELTGATVQMNTDYDEELDTDRLVEQELEKLSTDSYSAHFAHEKSGEDILEMEQISVKETDKQEASVYTAHFESEIKTKWESTDINEVSERHPFTDPSMETHSTNNLTEEALKEQEETGNPAVDSTSELEIKVNSEFGPFTTITGEATERHLFSDLLAEMHSTNYLTEKVLIEQTETDKATVETYTSEPEMKVNSEFGPFSTITGEATERHLFSDLLAEMHSTNDLTEKVLTEQKETDKETEETYSSEPEISGGHDHVTSLIVEDEALETQHFPEPYVKMYSANTLTEGGTQHHDPEAVDKSETREEDEEGNKMSHIEATEHQCSLEDVFSRSGVEDVKNIQDRGSVLLETEDLKPLEDVDAPPEVTEALPEEEISVVAQEHHIEDAENVHRLAIDGKTAEWKNTGKEFERNDQEKQDPKSADAPELSDDDIIIHQEEPVEVSPDRALNENDIFTVKDATESSFHGHFSSDGKNDFWVSSLETGATYPPGEAYKEAAEVTTDSQGFSENIDGGNFENPKLVNGNSKMHMDPSGLDPYERAGNDEQ